MQTAAATRHEIRSRPSIVALFVEDDDSIARIFELAARWADRLLSACRLETHLAASVDEGLEKVAKLQPDICFVDRLLPGGDGLEVADVARRTHARVAVLSSFSIEDLAARPDGEPGEPHRRLGRLGLEQLGKRPSVLRKPLRDKLIAMATVQAEAIARRRRRTLSDRVYGIGSAEHVAGSDRIVLPDGRVKALAPAEREILGFFCTYPRATLSLDDVRARLAPATRLDSIALDLIVDGLNDKLRGCARIEWAQEGGFRMGSRVSIRRFTRGR